MRVGTHRLLETLAPNLCQILLVKARCTASWIQEEKLQSFMQKGVDAGRARTAAISASNLSYL